MGFHYTAILEICVQGNCMPSTLTTPTVGNKRSQKGVKGFSFWHRWVGWGQAVVVSLSHSPPLYLAGQNHSAHTHGCRLSLMEFTSFPEKSFLNLKHVNWIVPPSPSFFPVFEKRMGTAIPHAWPKMQLPPPPRRVPTNPHLCLSDGRDREVIVSRKYPFDCQ